MFMNQETNADDFLSTLGNIYGIAELVVTENQESNAASNVLVAENALIFLAWEFNSGSKPIKGN